MYNPSNPTVRVGRVFAPNSHNHKLTFTNYIKLSIDIGIGVELYDVWEVFGNVGILGNYSKYQRDHGGFEHGHGGWKKWIITRGGVEGPASKLWFNKSLDSSYIACTFGFGISRKVGDDWLISLSYKKTSDVTIADVFRAVNLDNIVRVVRGDGDLVNNSYTFKNRNSLELSVVRKF